MRQALATFLLVGIVFFVIGILFSLSGCALTEKELISQVKADLWLHEKIPAEICNQVPVLKQIGLYRVITCTNASRAKGLCAKGQATYDERVSYCNINVESQFAMHQREFNKWIEQLRKALKQ